MQVTGRVVYRSRISDNTRWDALELRDGDIVISAPSKCGVTLTQRLVSLLVFDGPDLPGSLSGVSPWLDRTARPIQEVVAALDAQPHRRFIKTHTPLDGLVLDGRVSYIGVGRDPRDAAMSELAQWDNMSENNLDRVRPDGAVEPQPGPPPDRNPVNAFQDWMEGPVLPPDGAGVPGEQQGLPPHGAPGPPPHGAPGPSPHGGPSSPGPPGPPANQGTGPAPGGPIFTPHGAPEFSAHGGPGHLPQGRRPFVPPARHMGSLANILHHFGTIWERRHQPNVAMFHYSDYRVDLVGEIVRLADFLRLDIARRRAEELAKHATLDAMRARAADLAPDSGEGVWLSNERFFRAGASGEWQEFFTEHVYRRYHHRINMLGSADMLAWAHEGRRGYDPDN